jgi:hypothetical protein
MQPDYQTLDDRDPLALVLDRVTHEHLHRIGRQDLLDRLEAGEPCLVDDNGELLTVRLAGEVIFATTIADLHTAMAYVRAQN